MSVEQFISDVRDINLSYLMLAQSIIRGDKAQALYRLGVSEPVADLLAQMSPQQLVRVASRNPSMCTVRFGDELIWGLLTDSPAPLEGAESNADRLHASVLMAGSSVAAMA